ncbi:unnamed protein product [Urochloa decumbens]|uniref:Uncharacterized protein n=1 Tax=Urochloa decumbens TaxID=240449 RepID=A0ABC9BR70_9POAL
MEEWRALAETAPGTCTAVALEISGAGGVLATVDRAHTMLGAVAGTLRTLPPAADDDVPADAFPHTLLEGAHRELGRLEALHASAGYVCELYAQRALADREASAPYMSWRGHLYDAVVGAGDAKERLRYAASEARAAEAALRVSRSFPGGSHGRASWRAAARRLAIDAADNAELALDALRRTRDAVVLESFEARRILNP